MLTTPSECARHARAELEVIIASLQLGELTRLLELGRKLLDAGVGDAGRHDFLRSPHPPA